MISVRRGSFFFLLLMCQPNFSYQHLTAHASQQDIAKRKSHTKRARCERSEKVVVAGLERYAKIICHQTVLLRLLIAFCGRIQQGAFKSLAPICAADLSMEQAMKGEILPI